MEYKVEGGDKGQDISDYKERARQFTEKYGRIKSALGSRFGTLIYSNFRPCYPSIHDMRGADLDNKEETVYVEAKEITYSNGLTDLTDGGLDEILKIVKSVEGILADKREFELDGHMWIIMDPTCDVKSSGEKFKTVLDSLEKNRYEFSRLRLSGSFPDSKDSVKEGSLKFCGDYKPEIFDTFFGEKSLFDQCSSLWVYFK